MSTVKCPDCSRDVRVKNDGGLYKHPCQETQALDNQAEDRAIAAARAARLMSDPAPTVEGPQTRADWKSEQHVAHYGGALSDPAPTVDAMDDDFDTPAPPETDKGPWFGAIYVGACSNLGCRIDEGDRIRADGQGGYECEDCGSFDDTMDRHVRVSLGIDPAEPDGDAAYDWQGLASAAAKRHAESLAAEGSTMAAVTAVLAVPTPDEFATPSTEADPFDTPATVVPEVKMNVSGQPLARRDYLKRYIVIDPELGDFRRTKKERKPFGITRATTFNKHAQNTIALNGWSKRNVVMGASLRPDILRRAHGLHHDTSKEQREALDRIVDELEKAAGAKVAADEGTFLHEFCDQVDAGLKTWQDAPPAYQQDIKRYVEALAKEGLEPVPGLIERTTFIREFGGVAGTFDRIFYHRPSGTYIIGDLKTGKTMKYAMDETECQEWTYSHGVNTTGIYDWNTDTWGRALNKFGEPITVSETVGVIIHMPVQGPEAGEVYLRYANLERGRAYAELNHAVNSYEKSKVRPFEMPAPPTWEERFSAATSGEHANQMWRQAKAEGVEGLRLNDLVSLAREALARVDTTP